MLITNSWVTDCRMYCTTPSKITCCFHCSADWNKNRINHLLNEKLPTEDAWFAARDKMLLPLLRSMAQLSHGVMPLRWTDLDIPMPEECLEWREMKKNRRLIRINFWELCQMARSAYDKYETNYVKNRSSDTFFTSFAAIANSTLDLLCEPDQTAPFCDMESILHPFDMEVQHLWFQIKLVKNSNTVAKFMYGIAKKERPAQHAIIWKVSSLE